MHILHYLKRLTRSSRCLLVFALLLPLQGCYTGYFRGQVLDADTKKPIEGVIVVADLTYRDIFDQWGILEEFNPDVYETVTDKDGRYAVLSRHPLDRPPQLRFFKPNYYPPGGEAFWIPPNKEKGTGWVVVMMPFEGYNWGEYMKLLGTQWDSEGNDCVVNCPRFILALQAETERLRRVAPKDQLHYIPDHWNMDLLRRRKFLLRYKEEHSVGGEKEK